MAPSNLTGKKLIQQGLPDLLLSDSSTTSNSTHRIDFMATLGFWSRFERDARRNFLQARWNNTVLDYDPDDRDNGPNHVNHEQLLCGDSVANGVDFNKVPDIAVMDQKARLLLVGEAKTPWVHEIEKTLNHSQSRFRRYLGQIARYMHLAQCKYGFLTTYDETIFLKQEALPGRRGKWNARGHQQDISNPALYRRKVSLRECFLYLITLACEERTAKNAMGLHSWITGDTLNVDKLEYLSEGSSGPSEGEGKEEEEKSRTPRSARQGDSRAARAAARERSRNPMTLGGLEDRTSRLTLTTRNQSRREIPWKEGYVDVYFSETRREWYYPGSQEERVYVELFEEEDPRGGTISYFIKGNYRYQVGERNGRR
ncbi:uncharacterized protein TRUGW13939_10575 [Talaromyces rugulosus]|uniref:Uncharacterized protein n=1 Tax=Talaromyces rugulosus TaxID=121627 RepID=A0A7H8RD15_TALRU|nr:uncharacterized protein TRUGW13939_10575 [Talaromyces rugulosus]QKX63405.1 hypothetical protein TRUGW13939_10575 [Talaromyces rugulosus]